MTCGAEARWNGRCPTALANAIPRVLQDDTPEDKKAIQSTINQIVFYPLKDFTGNIKTIEWSKAPTISRMPSMMAQTKTIASITASPSALSKGVGQDEVMQSGRAADALARKVDDPLRNDLSAVRIAFEYPEIGAGQLQCD